MRFSMATLISVLACSVSMHAQTNTAASFLAQVVLKYPSLLTNHSMNLTGSAQWTAGALQESGGATLQAATDGSSTLQLALQTAARSETRTALGPSRNCQWTDAAGLAHSLNLVDCSQPVAWFAPMLLVQPSAEILGLLALSDDGLQAREGADYRQVSYTTPVQVSDDAASAKLFSNATRVSVLFDPNTLLPASLEYSVHADNDVNTALKVRVVFSNYQTVSGIPVPFAMERYVNGALQLSIQVGNASVQ